MKTNKKPVKQNDGITKKEKADLKKIAAQVAIDHKGTKKPQPLQPMKGDDIVTLCTFPVVRWEFETSVTKQCDKKALCKSSMKRIVKDCSIAVTAAEAKEFRDKYKGDMVKIAQKARVQFRKKIFKETGFHIHDMVAINEVRNRILFDLEKIGLGFEYDKDNFSLEEIRIRISELCMQLKAVRDFERLFKFYESEVKDYLWILPDTNDFELKDGKFVPVEKPNPEIPKKDNPKKK